MRLVILTVVLIYFAACGTGELSVSSLHEEGISEPVSSGRYPREAEPQGSVVVQGTKPLGGPDRRPSLDVNYNHRILDNGRTTVDAFGGLNKSPGQPFRPQAGVQFEHNINKNTFIRGQGQVQHGPSGRLSPSFGVGLGYRFKREVEPKGSVVIQATKPLSGPERRPSLDVNYNHRIIDNGRTTVDAFGGLNKSPGEPFRPQVGAQFEHNFNKNTFLRGQGQVQHGPTGRLSPSFGVGLGYRFKREVEPKGSVVIQATKPLSGPERRPSLDVNYNHRIIDNGRTTVDAFGGLNKSPGEPFRPQVGAQFEHNFNKNTFLRGQGQVQHGPTGRLSPSFGVGLGYRFKREADPQGSVVVQGTKPLSGPDRRPSLDVNYNHRILDNGRTTVDAFGGLNKSPGAPFRPQVGAQFEHNFNKNAFIRGQSTFQHGPSGRFSPSFGVGLGYRFKREAEPQGSVVIQGTKPLSGPDRRPSLDVNYNHRILDNGRTTVDAFGGLNKSPGAPIRPQVGAQFEHNINKNAFIRGQSTFQHGPSGRLSPSFGVGLGYRFKREAEPQGSVVIQGTKPLSGPDRRPSLDVNYNHRILDNGRTTVDAFGGLNKSPGAPFRPQVGAQFEHNINKNAFIRGQSTFQHGPSGRFSPSFGVGLGYRFKREAEPQGSVVVQGTKPLSGPDRRPSLDVNYNHRILDNGRTTVDAFGGLHKSPGAPFRPQVGAQFEHNINKNAFIRGQSTFQHGPSGRLSPSFGVGLGYRFRREADDVDSAGVSELEGVEHEE